MDTERPDHDDAAEAAPTGTPAGGAQKPSGRPGAPGPEVARETGGPDGTAAAGTDAGPEAATGTGRKQGGGGWFGRRRSPLAAVSVAAAVLLVGGGGAYLATGASGGGTEPVASDGNGTPPPLVLDDSPGASTGGTGGTGGIAPGEPNPYGVTYRAAGPLPTGPGSAPVYAARGAVSRDEVARLARALGVEGTPVADAQAWRIGAGKDGAGPLLRVNRQAPGGWTFSRYAPGTDDCKGVLCAHDPGTPAVHPVSAAAARKVAAPVLEAVGQDDAKVDASRTMGAQRVVDADPRIGGLPTHGWTTDLVVDAQGELVGGSGQLKAPVKADTYPVLGARETLELMNAAPRTDHRMGIGGCADPVPLKDRLEAPCGTAARGDARGDALTVETAVFGLASHFSDGRRTLVPSWLFQVRAAAGGDGFTVAYPAVAPEYLAGAATASATPSGRPEPRPSGSATGAPVTREVPVTGYRARGDGLTVTFEGGVCSDYGTAVRQGSDRVTVTVTETRWPDRVCIEIARVYHRTVRLDRPLGEREVVGPGGAPVPPERAGSGLPGSPPADDGRPVG
ncbi:hypothetical protein ACF061_01840 [Streptomyces sp. NPDC015220]|uniref:hypothetical protein n=1 Tax=Streptomyces sp. NPDC015220 TaxID=3364947 RepID=UPI0036FC6D5E